MAKKTLIEKMEEAAGIEESTPKLVPKTPVPAAPPTTPRRPSTIPSGGTAPFYEGPRPWKKLQEKSTEGSEPFTDAELKRGYRKL